MLKKIKAIKSPRGNEITLYQSGNDNPILLIGNVHGNETEGSYLLENFIDFYNNQKLNKDEAFLIIPCLNPDGKQLKIRANANNVDLNRNLPTKDFIPMINPPHSGTATSGGPIPEIENQFLLSVIKTYKPKTIISIHSDLAVINYDGPAKELAKTISAITGYKLVSSIGYNTPGSLGTWAGKEQNIPTITIETEQATTTKQQKKLWQKFLPLFAFLTNQEETL